MPKKVRIPTPLRKLTNNEELVEKGEVRRFVNVYVNEEDIRFLKNRETPLKDGDEISIIPAIAGG